MGSSPYGYVRTPFLFPPYALRFTRKNSRYVYPPKAELFAVGGRYAVCSPCLEGSDLLIEGYTPKKPLTFSSRGFFIFTLK